MSIVDFHTHILPGIDDGSRDAETSIRLLEESAAQGIEHLYLTPHFYPQEQSLDSFIRQRRDSLKSLVDALHAEAETRRTEALTRRGETEALTRRGETEALTRRGETGTRQTGDGVTQCGSVRALKIPRLSIGAEIAFFDGISGSKCIDALTLSDMRRPAILLEMPYKDWSTGQLDEVEKILNRNCTVIIAHVERFMTRSNRKNIDRLCDMAADRDIIFQINSDSVIESKRNARKLLNVMKDGGIRFILGSDCHSLHRRPQNMAEGRKIIDKYDSGMLQLIDELSGEITT